MESTVFLISLYLAFSLAMGFFSVTQRGYQHRDGGWKIPIFGAYAFLKGFFLWPFFFPYGIFSGKYKMNAYHKIGRHEYRD